MAMRRRRGEKKPLAFYIIIGIAIILSILFVVWIPIPEPIPETPAKTLLAMLLIIGLSFFGIWLYARKLRK